MTDERRAYAVSKGFDDQRVDVQFERFVNHAKANDRRQVDWDRSWQNWVLGDIQRNGTAPTSKPTNGYHSSPGERSMANFDRVIAQMFPEDVDDGSIIETNGVVQ